MRTNVNDTAGDEPGPTPVPTRGLTLAELCLIVLGAAVGALPLGQDPVVGRPLSPDECVLPATPVLIHVMLPLAGLLMVGPVILILRLVRWVPIGPGEVVWTLLGPLALPYWLSPLVWYRGDVVSWFSVAFIYALAAVAWWLALATAIVATGVCMYRARLNHATDWLVLVLAWAWAGCLVARGPLG